MGNDTSSGLSGKSKTDPGGCTCSVGTFAVGTVFSGTALCTGDGTDVFCGAGSDVVASEDDAFCGCKARMAASRSAGHNPLLTDTGTCCSNARHNSTICVCGNSAKYARFRCSSALARSLSTETAAMSTDDLRFKQDSKSRPGDGIEVAALLLSSCTYVGGGAGGGKER